MKNKIIIVVVLILVLLLGVSTYFLLSRNQRTNKVDFITKGKTKVKLTDYSYEGDSILEQDLDGDGKVDTLDLHDKKIAYIVDLNNDGKPEFIEKNVSTMISPQSTSYTIYNYKNNNLVEIGSFSIIGSIPDDTVYMKGNTLSFTYKPYESAPGYESTIECKLKTI